MSDNFNRELIQLAEVRSSFHESRLRDIQFQETKIRQGIAALNDQVATDLDDGPSRDIALQSIGADLLWNAWVSRTRRNLQIELARVLARKGAIVQETRQAIGNKLAASALATQAEQDERRRLHSLFEEQLQHDGLMQIANHE